MKATDLLKKQHQEVRDLFQKIEDTDDEGEKEAFFEELAANLVAHDAIEREIFYPACEEELGMDEMLGEALVEHGVVEFSLYRCDQNVGTENFEYYVTVLKESVEHHAKEEENELLKKCEKAFGAKRLEELGAAMETRFAEALAEDFREPLFANLEQVLAGRMETKPQPAAKKAAPKKTAKKSASAKSTKGNGRTHTRPSH